MKTLPLFHKIAGTRVVVLGDGDEAVAKRRLVERAGGICVGEPEAHHARLAFVGIEDEGEAKAAALRLRQKGLIVNVVDRPAMCDFTTPAVVDRDPVLIAVGTGGASAGLAKHIRLRLEALLPAKLGNLASGLEAARDKLREAIPVGAQRRQALDLALGEGGALDPLDEGSAEKIDQWMDAPAVPAGPERVVLKITSDDPEELTLRQARLLGRADHVLIGEGIVPAIVSRARADAVRMAVADAPSDLSGLTVELQRV